MLDCKNVKEIILTTPLGIIFDSKSLDYRVHFAGSLSCER